MTNPVTDIVNLSQRGMLVGALGGVVLALLWKSHRVIGFVVGSVAASAAYTAYAGMSVVANEASSMTDLDLSGGGTPYGTLATTDVRKANLARGFIPGSTVTPTTEENALMGIFG